MTTEQRREKLLSHSDTIQLDICGTETPWLLGKLSIRLGEAKGVKVGEALNEMDGDTDMAAKFSAFAKLAWVGTLCFDPESEEEDLTDLLSMGDMLRLLPSMMDSIMDAAEEEAQKAAAGKAAAAQGAANRKKR